MTSQVDVLVLYTAEAAQRLGADPQVAIQQVFDLQNHIFAICKVDAKVSLWGVDVLREFVEQQEIPESLWNNPDLESGDLTKHVLCKIAHAPNDQYNVDSRRKKYNADLVSI